LRSLYDFLFKNISHHGSFQGFHGRQLCGANKWDGLDGWDLCVGLLYEHRFAMLINVYFWALPPPPPPNSGNPLFPTNKNDVLHDNKILMMIISVAMIILMAISVIFMIMMTKITENLQIILLILIHTFI